MAGGGRAVTLAELSLCELLDSPEALGYGRVRRDRTPWSRRTVVAASGMRPLLSQLEKPSPLGKGSLEGAPRARHLQVVGKGNKTRAIPHRGRAGAGARGLPWPPLGARIPRHDLDHPATPLFVDVRGQALSVDQVKYLIERLSIRAGLRARVPAGACTPCATPSPPPPPRGRAPTSWSYRRSWATRQLPREPGQLQVAAGPRSLRSHTLPSGRIPAPCAGVRG